jgi:prephenate dehydratase
MKKIAIIGARGTFHELAANNYFGKEITIVPCASFQDVFKAITLGRADYGITAIENTVAGTILPNYALLRESDVTIVGEVYLHIQQTLLALPGQTIQDLTEVHSHPMALLQCRTYFDQYPHIKLVEASDTATSAKLISEKELKHIGAIAGTHVAGLYHLDILQENIETHTKNFTRFLITTSSAKLVSQPVNDSNKASVCFNVIHEKGNLATILTMLAENDINLTKIQSLPIVGKEWQYYIHIDMEFNNIEQYQKALRLIKPRLNEFKILGEYKCGDKEVALSTSTKP